MYLLEATVLETLVVFSGMATGCENRV